MSDLSNTTGEELSDLEQLLKKPYKPVSLPKDYFQKRLDAYNRLAGKYGGDIRPEGREHVGDWRIAQGRTTSRIFIPLGNNNAFAIQREIGQILLFNEAFGNIFPIRVIGFGQNNGTLYAVGETPTIHPSSANPRLWFLNHGWSIGAMSTGFGEVGPEYYENNRFEVEAKDAQLVTFDGREIPFGVMIFDKRNTEYAKSRKPGKYQGDAVQQTLFFNPNMDVKSEEEIEANNLIHGVKAIRAYAKAGRRDFATFAKAVATRKPEVYARIKTSLRNEQYCAYFERFRLFTTSCKCGEYFHSHPDLISQSSKSLSTSLTACKTTCKSIPGISSSEFMYDAR